jgi:membrane associated rhomboid family serine protease
MTSKERAAALKIPLILVGVVWAAFLLDVILPWDAFRALGLMPRTAGGAWGIVGMPFVHAGFGHLISNTIPLLVLGTLLVAVGRGWGSIAAVIVLSGLLLWLFGRGGRVHGGASGLVYGLAALLIGAGLIEKKVIPLLVAALVAILYGGSLLLGVLPFHPGVSWDGHLAGAVAGVCVAARSKKKRPEPQSGAKAA